MFFEQTWRIIILSHTLWALARNKFYAWCVLYERFHLFLFFVAQRAEGFDMPLTATVFPSSTEISLDTVPETDTFLRFHAHGLNENGAEPWWGASTGPR